MRCYANQLPQQLSRQLHPVYLVFGDEPLQKIESLDAIRHTAKAQGFEERQQLTVDQSFDWHQLFEAFNSLSLFSSRKIVELEMEKAKPGQAGAKVLNELTGLFNPDTILVIHGGKIDAASQKAKWFKTLDSLGVFVPLYAIEGEKFNRWLDQRARNAGLRLTPPAQSLLAQLSAGNLLSAAQEIDKLALGYANQTIDEPLLQGILLNQSRFTVFQLVDELLLGNTDKAISILVGLQNEGIEPVIVNWALSREVLQLYEMQTLLRSGMNMAAVLKQFKVWQSRTNLISAALGRLSMATLESLIDQLASLDIRLKTNADSRPYIDFCHICVEFGAPGALTVYAPAS